MPRDIQGFGHADAINHDALHGHVYGGDPTLLGTQKMAPRPMPVDSPGVPQRKYNEPDTSQVEDPFNPITGGPRHKKKVDSDQGESGESSVLSASTPREQTPSSMPAPQQRQPMKEKDKPGWMKRKM